MTDTTTINIPKFESYGDYSSKNYGVNTLVFTDTEGRDFFFSYKTLVAVSFPTGALIVRENEWGLTTGRHLALIDGGEKAARAARLSEEQFNAALEALL